MAQSAASCAKGALHGAKRRFMPLFTSNVEKST